MTILVVGNNTAVTDELSEKLRIIKSDTKIVVAIAGIMKAPKNETIDGFITVLIDRYIVIRRHIIMEMTAENNRDCKKIEFRRFVRSSIFFYGYFSDLSKEIIHILKLDFMVTQNEELLREMFSSFQEYVRRYKGNMTQKRVPYRFSQILEEHSVTVDVNGLDIRLIY